MNQVEFSIDELRNAMRHDCVAFFSVYIGADLTLEVPDFHVEIWDELLEKLATVSQPDFLVGHLQKLFAVPREHAKSTLIKLAVILFMRYSPLAFTLYVSKTNTIAVNAIKDVMTWLQCENEVILWGAPRVVKSNETESIWIIIIGTPYGPKRVVLKALGAGQQARGLLIENKRPELIILDDIEDLDTADDGVQQQKLDEWALGSLLKASARRSVRIFIGNMIRSTTLLARLSKDPEWNPTVFGALVRDKITGEFRALWEGRWTVDSLLQDYRRYRRLGRGYIWEAEMMNLSQDSLHLIDLSNAVVIPMPNPEEITAGFLTLDPAFGQKNWNDESAITVHVRVQDRSIPFTVDSRHGRWSESVLLDNMLELSYYWNIRTWCIESVAAQKLLIPLFKLMMKDRLIAEELFLMLPIQAGKDAKASRIVAYRKAISDQSYGLSDNMIELQNLLEGYAPDKKEHDDLVDSGAYGPIAWATHGEVIESAGNFKIAGALMQDSNPGQTYGEFDVCQF